MKMKGHARRNSQVGWVGRKWVRCALGFCSKGRGVGWLAGWLSAAAHARGGRPSILLSHLRHLFSGLLPNVIPDVFPLLILPSPTPASTSDTAKRRKESSTTDISQARRGRNYRCTKGRLPKFMLFGGCDLITRRCPPFFSVRYRRSLAPAAQDSHRRKIFH